MKQQRIFKVQTDYLGQKIARNIRQHLINRKIRQNAFLNECKNDKSVHNVHIKQQYYKQPHNWHEKV